ncbi:MAG: hypothetical protein A2091_10705 [Desulfuromonadales bacterium GWD2_61_12]|nr:MAG: hypothetical protein A2005_12330 [Desulfuromonadales bacterium GWC2_61_20]OGR34235.1 MAG: hypothetical protein A2091_10705 [Desulfuromonadales bacterium GWD2_61_12]
MAGLRMRDGAGGAAAGAGAGLGATGAAGLAAAGAAGWTAGAAVVGAEVRIGSGNCLRHSGQLALIALVGSFPRGISCEKLQCGQEIMTCGCGMKLRLHSGQVALAMLRGTFSSGRERAKWQWGQAMVTVGIALFPFSVTQGGERTFWTTFNNASRESAQGIFSWRRNHHLCRCGLAPVAALRYRDAVVNWNRGKRLS